MVPEGALTVSAVGSTMSFESRTLTTRPTVTYGGVRPATILLLTPVTMT